MVHMIIGIQMVLFRLILLTGYSGVYLVVVPQRTRLIL